MSLFKLMIAAPRTRGSCHAGIIRYRINKTVYFAARINQSGRGIIATGVTAHLKLLLLFLFSDWSNNPSLAVIGQILCAGCACVSSPSVVLCCAVTAPYSSVTTWSRVENRNFDKSLNKRKENQ